MNKNPEISVIVPVYNAEDTLEKCIESILKQSFKNFELLLINDGSKDESSSLCDKYSRYDSRILVFHKTNGGVSSARNKGLSECKGGHILFCDADDYLDKYCIEKLVEYRDSDIVLCSYETVPNGEARRFPDSDFAHMDSIVKCLKDYIYSGFSTPWAKLYRRDLIIHNSLFFDEQISSCEDALWVSRYLLYVKSIKLLSYRGYFYNRGDTGSLSSQSVSETRMDVTINKLVASYDDLEQKFQMDLTECKLYASMYLFHRFILQISKMALSDIILHLKRNCEKEHLKPIFYDREYILKGKRLKFFNFLVRHRLYRLLSLNVKVQKRYL